MKKHKYYLLFSVLFFFINHTFAQNPIITDQFTADPSARVFNGKVYVYPSHDIRAKEGQGRPGWFCMEDYHVFSSENLTDWTDHGVIVSQNKVEWVDSTTYSLWAPDCICRNGKYYFYFPAQAKDTLYGKGFSIGVAISDNPFGPFIPQPKPINNVHGIDPCPFIDKDGQAYLYWGGKEYEQWCQHRRHLSGQVHVFAERSRRDCRARAGGPRSGICHGCAAGRRDRGRAQLGQRQFTRAGRDGLEV